MLQAGELLVLAVPVDREGEDDAEADQERHAETDAYPDGRSEAG